MHLLMGLYSDVRHIQNDLTFNGGAIGIHLTGQQFALKGISFNRCTVGVKGDCTDLVLVDCTFTDCGTGVDATDTDGSLTVLDTSSSTTGMLINGTNSGNAGYSIILESIQSGGATVVLSGQTLVSGNIVDTWVHGDTVRTLHALCNGN